MLETRAHRKLNFQYCREIKIKLPAIIRQKTKDFLRFLGRIEM